MERAISKRGKNEDQEGDKQNNFYFEKFSEKHRIDHDFVRLKRRIDKTQKDLLLIANELLLKNKDSNVAKFILRTAGKVTLFAELTTRGIHIPDNNNHVENLMGIVGQRVKKNRQSWVDKNLNIILNTIWHNLLDDRLEYILLFRRNLHLVFPGNGKVFKDVFSKTSRGILKQSPTPGAIIER